MAVSTPYSSIVVATCDREGGARCHVHAVLDKLEGTVEDESSVGSDRREICDALKLGGIDSSG